MFCARSRQTPAIQKTELDSSAFCYDAARDAYVCPERWPGGTDGQPILGRIVAMGWPSHSRRRWLSLVPVEPARRKRYSVCDELFYFTANLVVHAFCCFSPLNCNRCAGLRPGRGNDSRGRLRTVLPYHFLSPSESSCSECIIGEQTHIFYAWVIVYGKAHVETISHLDCLYRSSRRPLRMADPGWHQSLYGNSGTASFVTARHRVPNCLGRSICTHGFRCRPDLLRTGVQGTYPRSAAFPCSVGVQLFLEHYLLQSPELWLCAYLVDHIMAINPVDDFLLPQGRFSGGMAANPLSSLGNLCRLLEFWCLDTELKRCKEGGRCKLQRPPLSVPL